MPIFLERHDYFKVTATDFARIHLEDLEVQHEFGCWVLAYWCDVKRKTTFCLIDAPNLESVKRMHCHIHQSCAGHIMQIEEDLIDYFLGIMENPKPSMEKISPRPFSFQKPGFYAVMVLKLYGNESLLSKNDTVERLLNNFKDCTQKIIRKNKGRRIPAAPHSCIYFFNSFSRSVKSAMQILDEIEVLSNNRDTIPIKVSIGIDGRKQIDQKCEFFEDTMTLAGRLCRVAGKNQVLISAKMLEQVHREAEALGHNPQLRFLSNSDEQFLSGLMEIIESNYREDLKIGAFCKKLGKSRSQLYRKIIEVTSLPPIELINEFRLNKSLEIMVMRNGSNISQVAFESGFNSLSYFSRKFKKRYGILPSEFLNRT